MHGNAPNAKDMRVTELINSTDKERKFSFEVLPPLKGNGTANLTSTIEKMRDYDAMFINITTHHSEYLYTDLDNGH